ncbi:hypothetical protein Tco_0527710 [Tanacetum coccineum]
MFLQLSDKVKQESEKSPEEIIIIKREQEEKKQEPTYTIKSTDQAALEEEFDSKETLCWFWVKDHKRKHDGDDDDDDDDEGPPAGSNQGKSTKKRRKRESESAKKPSTTKESSKDKDPKVGSKTGKSAPAKDPVEEPTEKVIMDEQPTEDIPISNEGHFWYTITKIKDSKSYEFLLADKKCVIDAEVFRKILDICPRKEGEDFTEVQNDEDTLTFLIDLGYSGPLHKYTNMFVDHMHQPWRTLAACINKCLSGKTASNDKLRKSRIDILWGMFYRENVDYPSLIWEDIAYQIDHRREKKSRRENMPYPRFTKVIIDYFLSKHKSLKKLKFQHFHTIKDDGVVSRLKFVRMGEDVQQYGLAIPATMLNNEIIQSESYKMFILYSTGQIPPKKSRGKGSQGKKTADTTEESVDVSDESDPEPLIIRKTSKRKVVKKKATISVDDKIIPEPDIALELGKSISLAEVEKEAAAREVHDTHARILKGIQSLTPAEQDVADIMKALKDSKKIIGRRPGTGDSNEGTGEIPGVPDESIFTNAEDDNEETESDYEDIYKYRINVSKNADIEMKDAEKTADITKETTEQPLTSSSFSVPSDYGNQFLNLSHDKESNKQPPVLQQTTPTLTTIPTPPINTEALAITTAISEITPFIALQLRVAKLEQDMSKVKKIDHSAAALERHTADLVEKYFVLPALESSKKQESEKSPEEIIRIKRGQKEKKQEPTYTIK